MTFRITLIAIILGLASCLQGQIILSHNDYKQSNPLHEAISKGYEIIEADVYLRDSIIVVCHDKSEMDQAPSMQELYIDPLQQYGMKEIRGKTLMLDIKEWNIDIVDRINTLRINTPGLFDHVTILLSGDIDRQYIAANPKLKHLKIDGRLQHLDSTISVEKMPVISMKITDVCNWKGCRRITNEQAQKLKFAIDQVHATGRKIRFWKVEDNVQAWNVLRALHVDIIGVDDLDKMYEYLSH